MSDNVHPYNQISDDEVVNITVQLRLIVARTGLDWDVCRDIMRAAYESGWNGALDTEGAVRFDRLTK
ncbi:hypothetical protein KAR91_17410 [Candidatus Pacearchaeota archaeon]|nr:hypothetical protein [Candidatus Pacearchaeota archaeon]